MEQEVRAILVGCGGMSHAWLSAAREIPNLRIVGLVDLKEEAAQRRAAEFGLADALIDTDLEAVLRRATPDVVFDCTVPEAHAPVTLQALAHGCHVLGEKPMADSLENARAMVAAAEAAGRIYAVIQNRRYDARIRRLRHFLQSGRLGQLTTFTSDFFIGAHFGGFRDRMEHVLLLDMAIHTFDAARFLTGADPVAVTCVEWNPPGSWYDHDAAAVATFEMTGGIVYSYRGSWCAEGLNTSWESDWRVIGTRGSVRWDGQELFQAEEVIGQEGFLRERRAVEIPEHDPGEKVGGHAGLLREFIRCVQSGETPETNCTDNIKSLAMVFGAIESARQGRRVVIEV
ncbi:MAG: Gfo/Idh/MocA family oxidoreductase [Armatimonadetes bacterium]|jgi:predicted dehydrogenase|nr:Gfo/Idh/MocA family oxidoreductase [Armatimonadota bacterium]